MQNRVCQICDKAYREPTLIGESGNEVSVKIGHNDGTATLFRHRICYECGSKIIEYIENAKKEK